MPEPEQRKAFCLHCGHEVHYAPGDEIDQARAWKALLDHDVVCQKNPLVAKVAELEEANGMLEGGKIDAEADRDRYRETIQPFLSTVLTVKRANQPEWMEYLAERINEVCEVIGEEDRVAYNPRQEAILPIKK
jgi:hypothetical protein